MGSAVNAVRQLEKDYEDLEQKYTIGLSGDKAALVDEIVKLREFVSEIESLTIIYDSNFEINPSCHIHIELVNHLKERLATVAP